MISLGLTTAYLASELLTLGNWNLILSLGGIAALLQFIVIGQWYDETPEYLYSLGEEVQAELNMRPYYQIEND
jgi:hypothetical protein